MSTATEELTAEQAEAALAALIAEAEPETETKPVKKAPAKKAAAPKPALFDLSTICAITKPRKADTTFSLLLAGLPKSGKTLLAGTANEVEALGPVVLLALEDGSSVLARDYPDMDVIEPENWVQAAGVIEALAEGNTGYGTVIVDTLGELQEHMKAHITEDGAKEMRIQDWGTIKDNTVNVVKMLHRAKINVIFITHSEEIKDENTGVSRIQPYLLGKGSLGEVPKIVDIIAYLAVSQDKKTKETFRVLQTGQDGKILAGDRFGKLEYQIINPTMAELFAQLTSESADTDADE
jgi:hypothetical protein